MLTITVQAEEYWDEEAERFIYPDSFELQLEHSLVSLSKWEALFKKPFLDGTERTEEESFAYVRFMLQTPATEDQIQQLSVANLEAIYEYVMDKQTATWITEINPRRRQSGEKITSELVYYWMTMFNIPLEAENWHLNRLFTLIRIANIKNSKPEKQSRDDVARQQRELNRQRREAMGSKG